MIGGSNYLRIYSYHSTGHGLKFSYKTSGLVGKLIPIDKHILMCSYTEESDAAKLYNLIKSKTKEEQCEIMNKLLNKCNIIIRKPDDIIIKYWKTGVHYNNVDYDEDGKKTYLLN